MALLGALLDRMGMTDDAERVRNVFAALPMWAGMKATNTLREQEAGIEPHAGTEATIADTARINRILSEISRSIQDAGSKVDNATAMSAVRSLGALRYLTSAEKFDDIVLEQAWDQHLPEETQ